MIGDLNGVDILLQGLAVSREDNLLITFFFYQKHV